jgi:hypothetical protein
MRPTSFVRWRSQQVTGSDSHRSQARQPPQRVNHARIAEEQRLEQARIIANDESPPF